MLSFCRFKLSDLRSILMGQLRKKYESELKSLGKRIKECREEKGLSQQQLADKLVKDKQSIQRIESGRTNPTYLTLHEISKALEVSITDLITVSSK